MPQNITVHVDALVAAAEREVETLSAADAIKLHGRPDVVFVDIRDIRELNREGPGAGRVPLPRAGCSSSGSIRKATTTSRSSPRTSASCSSAPAACAPRSRRRPCSAWACGRSRMWRAASVPGGRRAGRSRRRSRAADSVGRGA